MSTESKISPIVTGFAIVLIVLIITVVYIRSISIEVYRFSKPHCQYCISSQDEWNKFKGMCMFKTIRPIDVDMSSASSGDKRLYNVVGATGVPTIVKIEVNGRVSTYRGDRTAVDLMKWVKA